MEKWQSNKFLWLFVLLAFAIGIILGLSVFWWQNPHLTRSYTQKEKNIKPSSKNQTNNPRTRKKDSQTTVSFSFSRLSLEGLAQKCKLINAQSLTSPFRIDIRTFKGFLYFPFTIR